MEETEGRTLKPLYWVASSKADLIACGEDVKDQIGYGLFLAQQGGRHAKAKSLHGFLGAGVLEIVADDNRGTYRGVYTVMFPKAVYVLHVFKKKSKKGAQTPKSHVDLIKERLRAAREHYELRYGDEEHG